MYCFLKNIFCLICEKLLAIISLLNLKTKHIIDLSIYVQCLPEIGYRVILKRRKNQKKSLTFDDLNVIRTTAG